MSHYDPILRGRPERCPTCDEFNILYGFGFVSDPRDFMPDEDCSTPEQRQRWRDDCARVKGGRPAEHLPRGCQHSTYGLGTYPSVVADALVGIYAREPLTVLALLEGGES